MTKVSASTRANKPKGPAPEHEPIELELDPDDFEELSGVTIAVSLGETSVATSRDLHAILVGDECLKALAVWRTALGVSGVEAEELSRRHDQAVADIVIHEATAQEEK